MARLAITGGIAEGKSTVLGYLRELGFTVASSDELAREVFLDDQIQESLARLLGQPPPIAPERLRAALWVDPPLRRAVNRLMHPRVLGAIRASHAFGIEVPLLYEACLQSEFERVWVVTCGPQEQRRRLAERLGSDEAAEAAIGVQLPTQVKCAFADLVVRTNRESEAVHRFVAAAAARFPI